MNNPLEDIFGQLEKNIGPEAYAANVAATQAQADILSSQAELHRAHIERMDRRYNLIGGIFVVLLLAALPLYVALLIYVFGMVL